MRKLNNAVFVDRSGHRRRAVIGVGVVIVALLLVWLALLGIGVVTVVTADGTGAAPNQYSAGA